MSYPNFKKSIPLKGFYKLQNPKSSGNPLPVMIREKTDLEKLSPRIIKNCA
jgi:hypothetical protein